MLDALKAGDVEKAATLYEQTTSYSTILIHLFTEPISDFEDNAFVTLSSTMKAINAVNSILKENELLEFNRNGLHEFIKNRVQKHLLNVLPWAIDSLDVVSEETTNKEFSYDISKVMRFDYGSITVCVKIKPILNKGFVIEVMKLFLESLNLNLSIKEREYSLRNLANEAQASNQSKDLFLANMSHELRTPLNAIIGFSQILMMKPELHESLKTYIEKITISGMNLLQIVNTILDFSKIEAGKLNFSPKFYDIALLINEVFTLIEPQAQAKKNHPYISPHYLIITYDRCAVVQTSDH
jgi:signal transduction histidine kinase